MDLTSWKFLIFDKYVAALATQPGDVSNTVSPEKGRGLKVPTHSHCIPEVPSWRTLKMVEASLNVMARAQKPNFVFRRNGRVALNRRGASVQSTTGSRGVRINGSNAGYTIFGGSVKSTGYPLHSPVSPSLPLPALPCAITFQLASTSALHWSEWAFSLVTVPKRR